MPTLTPLTPEWWIARLYKRLVDQQKQCLFFDDYYRGAFPLPWLAPQAKDEFKRVLKMARANIMGLIVDAQVERCNLEGFRVGDAAEGDRDTWAIWQANNLDTFWDQGLLEAAITGQAYTLTAPNPKDPSKPLVWIEHPTQAIVEYEPGTNRTVRAAGLKVWVDDWTDKLCATLQLAPMPNDPKARLFKFEARRQPAGTPLTELAWTRRVVPGEDWGAENPLGVVSLVEIPNNPRLLTGGVSELADVVDIQDRINKTLADRLITQDYGAFPQKWATGWPEEDDDGNPTKPINVGRDRMVTTDVLDAKFGQFDAASLDPYSGAKREDVKDAASRTRTPAQYLLGDMSNVNGETLKAAESGLVSKCRQRMRNYGEAAEETARLARRAAGLPDVGDERMESIWRNPEFRTEGELTDSLVKMDTLHVPFQVLWEKWGATPQEVVRWAQLNQQNADDPQLAKVMQSITQVPFKASPLTAAPPAAPPDGTVP